MSYNPIKTANNEININATNILVSNNIIIDNDPTLLYTDASLNRIGVLTTTPAYTFDVSGSINAQQVLVNGSPLVFSYWSANSNDIYNINSGNVGINNSTPSHKLDVSGNINNNNAYLINGTSVLTSNTLGAGVLNSSLTSVGILNTLDVSGNMSITNGNLDINNSKLLNVTNIDTINNNINIRTLSDNDINIIRNTSNTNLSLKATEITTNSDLNLGNQTLKTQNVDNSGATLNLGNNSTSINIGCGSNIQTVNIGSNSSLGVTTINIGGSGDIVNIDGSLNYIYATDLKVANKTIELNSNSSGSGTARNSGISIRDNNIDNQGYIQVSSLGSFYDIKAPENGYVLSTPILTRPDTVATVLEIQDEYVKLIGDQTITGNIDISGNLDLTSGYTYKINNNDVLTGSSLGSGVTASSLTSVGTLTSLTVSGDLTVDTSTLKVDSNNNRVGINNSSPSNSLSVISPDNIMASIRKNANTNDAVMEIGTSATNNAIYLGWESGKVAIGQRGVVQILTKDASGTNLIGNIGINQPSPSFTLDVNGSGRILEALTIGKGLYDSSIFYKKNNIDATSYFHAYDSTNDLLNTCFRNSGGGDYIYSSLTTTGNFGIGTTSPLTKLQTNFTSSDSTFTGTNKFCGIHIQPETNTNDKYVGLTFGAIDPTEGATRKQTQAGIVCQSSSSYGTRLYFLTSNSYGSGMSSRMLLDPAGRLGIGTTNPSYLLDVSGDANLSANNWYRIGGNKCAINIGFSLFLGATPLLNRIRPSGWNVSSGITRVSAGEYTLTLGLNQPTPSQTGICVITFENDGNHKHRVVARFGTSTQIAIDTYNNDVLADLEVNASILIIYD